MSERRRLNLSLSMNTPHQREAWKILRTIPAGQRTDTVCRMICKAHGEDQLLNGLRLVIREELNNCSLRTEKMSGPQRTGDVDEDVLGFLRALQEGDETS